MKPKLAAAAPAVRRCAVYTRKSSDEGLEQSFNSLHAQRDACEAYVRSQVHEGWSALPAQYDDGGFSGGSMERPGLKALLADIAAGLIDVVVVYKVDRLTRSLGDFARIVEQFDAAGVSFVSVTQAFNTTSSMGRLTLNVLLSFAQFEREVTGERIRDKIALSKAKGMWMGSVPPLGYDKGDHILLINEAEAETVRAIYRRYLQVGSVHRLCAELEAQGVVSKRHVTTAGRILGGVALTRGALFHLLQNRHYVGEIVHGEISHPGLHVAILDRTLFDAVQARLAKNRVIRRRRSDKAAAALLTGRIFDGEGRPFSPTFSTGRGGRVHRYYVAADLQQGREPAGRGDTIRRVGAEALERLILAELRRLSGRPELGVEDVPGLLRRLELRPLETQLVLDSDALIGLDHPDLALEDLRGRLGAGERLVEERGASPALRISLPRRMQLRGGRTWILVDGDQPDRPRHDPALIEALRKGHRLLADVADGAPEQRYARKLVQLALLAPELQRDILTGRQPAAFTLVRFLKSPSPPLDWAEHQGWAERLA